MTSETNEENTVIEANESQDTVDELTTTADAPSVDEDDASSESVIDDVDKGDWYIVQCYTGHEHKVQLRVLDLIERNGYQDKIFRVLVPEEESIEIKNNKRVERVSRIFPGYLFVQMLVDEEVLYEIRRLAGVAKFVGSKTAPTPVTEDEILKVLRKVGDKTKKVDVDFDVDEIIKVIDGPFRGYSGPISEINADRGKLKALILIFGRETPVELEFDQVEKTVK